jgi:hypothetical protein
MMSLRKIIRNLLAIAGLIMLMGAIGTSDYYVIELEQVAPSYCNRNIVIGIALMLPMVIHLFYEMYKEGKKNV